MADFSAVERLTRSGESIVLRSAHAADALGLLGYFKTIAAESAELTFGAEGIQLSSQAESDHVEWPRRSENSLMLVATLQNEIVGNLTFTGGAKPSTAHAGDIGVSVLQKHWNKGIARLLFDALFTWVTSNAAIRKLNLRVRATNTRAATLYACLGFAVEGRQSRIAIVDGRFEDGLQMGMCCNPTPLKGYGAIRRATSADVDEAWSVVHEAAQALHAHGVHQWHQNYPTRDTIQADIRDARLFALERDGRIDAVVTLNEEQDPLWSTLRWTVGGRALVVHRLCVRPSAQRAGLGKRLMSFAETLAEVEGAQCVRLDAYSENADALRLYEGRGYHRVGSLQFPHRVAPFVCFERPTRWSRSST